MQFVDVWPQWCRNKQGVEYQRYRKKVNANIFEIKMNMPDESEFLFKIEYLNFSHAVRLWRHHGRWEYSPALKGQKWRQVLICKKTFQQLKLKLYLRSPRLSPVLYIADGNSVKVDHASNPSPWYELSEQFSFLLRLAWISASTSPQMRWLLGCQVRK